MKLIQFAGGVMVYLLIFLGWPLPTHADTQIAERAYAMPLSETQEVLVSWLHHKDFAFSQSATEQQGFQFIVDTKENSYRIDLSPQSPLGTRIVVGMQKTGPNGFISALWSHLDGYLKKPTSISGAASVLAPASVQQYLAAVVCIYFEGLQSETQLSGFVISPQGFLVSTAHDLTLNQTVRVQFYSGQEKQGQVIALDAYRDLSLIRIQGPVETLIPWQNGRHELTDTDRLFLVPCPGSGMDGIQMGSLAGPPRRVDGLPLWQANMHIEHGSSGSPILDAHGQLAAIVKGRYRGTNTIGFLIPYETLQAFMKACYDNGIR